MSKLFSAVALIAMASVLACGGNGGGGGFGSAQRMTVEEYAAACEALGARFNDLGSFDEDFSTGFDAIEDAIDEIKKWNPPGELQEYHGVRVRAMETALDALQGSGLLDLMQDLEKAAEEEDETKVLELLGDMADLEDRMSQFEDDMAEFEDEIERTQDGLSPETRRILENADCL